MQISKLIQYICLIYVIEKIAISIIDLSRRNNRKSLYALSRFINLHNFNETWPTANCMTN